MTTITAAVLAIVLHFEGGYIPTNKFTIYDSMSFIDNSNKQMYINLGVEFEILGFFFIGGDIRTEMFIRDFAAGSFVPTLENYGFNFGIRPAEWIEIGFRHHCIHPMMTYIYQEMKTPNWEGAFEEVYLKIDVKVDLIK